jgi:AcrR family transcriptional regulator
MSTEERRHQIVAAAAGLFDTHGYGNTSMEDVAFRVSIAKPTLYHYFRSKEEILRSIHEEFIQILIDKYMERISSGLDPENLLLGAMKDIFSLMVTHRGYVRVFFEHQRELTSEAKLAEPSRPTRIPSSLRWRCSACATGRTSGSTAVGAITRTRSRNRTGGF